MIEFDGYIFGEAEKVFFKRTRDKILNFLAMIVFVMTPSVKLFSLKVKLPFFEIMIMAYLIIFIGAFVLSAKKRRTLWLTKRVIIEKGTIVSFSDKMTDTRFVKDVKKVTDRGSFYEIRFSLWRKNDVVICQKCLLTRGSIFDFESLFSDKMVRKTGSNTDNDSQPLSET